MLEDEAADVDGPARRGVVHGTILSCNVVIEHGGAAGPAAHTAHTAQHSTARKLNVSMVGRLGLQHTALHSKGMADAEHTAMQLTRPH